MPKKTTRPKSPSPTTSSTEQTTIEHKMGTPLNASTHSIAPIAIIAGDICADWLIFEMDQEKNSTQPDSAFIPAWKMGNQVFIPAVHGGAWIVERFMRMLLPLDLAKNLFTYKRLHHRHLRTADSSTFLHQFTTLRKYPSSYSPNTQYTYRAVPKSYRFSGPSKVENQAHPLMYPFTSNTDCQTLLSAAINADKTESASLEDNQKSQLTRLTFKDPEKNETQLTPEFTIYPGDRKRVIILFDRGNGFIKTHNLLPKDPTKSENWIRSTSPQWKYLFYAGDVEDVIKKSNSSASADAEIIEHIYLSLKVFPDSSFGDTNKTRQKLHPRGNPAQEHSIIEFIKKNRLSKKTTVILDANDLRRHNGLITRGLSWERTAEDTIKLLREDRFLRKILEMREIVIRFGLSGALVRLSKSRLNFEKIIFDPQGDEIGYGNPETCGVMYPIDAVLTSSIASEYLRNYAKSGGSLSSNPRKCIDSIKNALAACRAYYDHGVYLDNSGRSAIEAWDVDLDKNEDKSRSDSEKVTKVQQTTKLVSVPIIGVNTFVTETSIELSEPAIPGLSNIPSDAGTLIVKTIGEAIRIHLKEITDEACTRAGISAETFNFEGKVLKTGTPKFQLINTYRQLTDAEWDSLLDQLVSLHIEELDGQAKREEVKSLQLRVEGMPPKALIVHNVLMKTANLLNVQKSKDFFRQHNAPFRLLARQGGFLDSPIGKDKWSIAPESRNSVLRLSKSIVIDGFKKLIQEDKINFPVVQFGELTVIDRFEIEAFRSLNTLFINYLKKKSSNRPLCAAVFGQPGQGKSFGVKQLAVGCGVKKSDFLEYNLSQFETRMDLERALINVRNACSPDKTPLVFFDEFDSAMQGASLGWLKMFLSVMQDGTFFFNGDLMQLGKSILIFAGGTSTSFEEFARLKNARSEADDRFFASMKGPDFVSRLRGHIDIASINPSDLALDSKCSHYLRRATIIRSIVERQYPALIDASGKVTIDPGVLNALICVPNYKHGARSLEALFEMSNLVDRPGFERSYLPSATQLAMHLGDTDVRSFMQLLFTQ
jgi:hypothetical protein